MDTLKKGPNHHGRHIMDIIQIVKQPLSPTFFIYHWNIKDHSTLSTPKTQSLMKAEKKKICWQEYFLSGIIVTKHPGEKILHPEILIKDQQYKKQDVIKSVSLP